MISLMLMAAPKYDWNKSMLEVVPMLRFSGPCRFAWIALQK